MLSLFRKIQWWLQRRRRDDELSEELEFHLAEEARERQAEGLSVAEARWAARRDLGNTNVLCEEVRAFWSWGLFDQLAQDVRYAFRTLRKSPAFTITAILTLALGIGANTALFSVIDGLILRKLPVSDPDRLVLMSTIGAPGGRAWNYPVWKEVEQAGIFERVAAWSLGRFNLAAGGETQFVDGLWASGSFFETLGVDAALGRTFTTTDDRSGGGRDGPVAVIGYGFWERHFARADDVIGRTITVDERSYTIIGVMPPAFYGMEVGRTFDIALPLELNRGSRSPTTTWLTIVGRLAPGETADATTERLQALQPQIRDSTLPPNAPNATPAYRKTYLQAPFATVPAARGSSGLRRQYQQPLFLIMAVVVLVMLIASVNIGNLLLARAADRRHEFNVRLALGASRLQLARHVLVESSVLAVAGASLGLMVASWASRALVWELAKQTTTQSTTVFLDVSLNWHVLAFTMVATIVSVLLFGTAPAVRAAQISSEALKEGLTTTRNSRGGLSSSFVVAQVALSIVLVVAAGLFIRTFALLAARPLGFDPEHVLLVTVRAERSPIASSERIAIFERATEAVRVLPGVSEAAASLLTPIGGLGLTDRIEVAGVPRPADAEREASINHVSPGYFRTLDTPILAGRDFTQADGPGASPVAIVNEAFGRTFLDGVSPIGHAIIGLSATAGIPIVGVVGDAVYRSLREPSTPTVFLPFAQSREASAFGLMSLSIRSPGPLEPLNRSVTAALNDVNPELTWTFRPLANQIDASITQERITAQLAGAFGSLALLLAGLGLYGVTAYYVTRRRFEIGIRMAFGATRPNIIGLVVSRVVMFVATGTAIGVAASLWAVRFAEALLFQLEARDPLTFSGAVAMLVVVALLAAWVPARRASRVDPMVALRHE